MEKPIDSITRGVLLAIREASYNVSVFTLRASLFGSVPACVELHAVRLGDLDEVQIAKVRGDHGPVDAYRRACLLAEMCGLIVDE